MDFATINVRNLVIRFLINAVSLFVADALIAGIHIEGWSALAVMSIIFGLVNAFARPIAKLITCPLIILTVGLFLLIVNTAMLGISAWLAGALGFDATIDGFWPTLGGAIVISIVGFILSMVLD